MCLLKFKILLKRQFKFRNNYLPNHALIKLTDFITNYPDNNYYICGIFIDLQKAFDTATNNICLAKLEYYCICRLVKFLLKNH